MTVLIYATIACFTVSGAIAGWCAMDYWLARRAGRARTGDSPEHRMEMFAREQCRPVSTVRVIRSTPSRDEDGRLA